MRAAAHIQTILRPPHPPLVAPVRLSPPLYLLTHIDPYVSPRPQASVTNVPLSSEPNNAFMWSFDRVVAGEAYTEETVQPVLHRYNDAKYIWSDTSAREWLDGFVWAHGPTVVGALDGAHGLASMRRVVIDLELEEGVEAARPILLD